MNKKQLMISAGIIVVLAIIYLISSTGRTVQKSVDADILSVDSARVDGITIIADSDTSNFVRGKDGWSLDGYRVDNSRFKRLFEELATLEADRFVSKNKTKYEKYGVDSSAAQIYLKNKSNKLLQGIFVGKTSSSGNETFIRVKDGIKVYAIAKNLGQYKKINRGNYWDKQIIDFKPDDVFSIKMEGDNNYLLEHKNMGWTYDAQLIDIEKGNAFVNKIVSQKASNVSKEEIPSTAMLKATATVTPRNGQPETIKYFENDDKSTTVYVERVGNPMRYEIYKSTFDSFNKTFNDLKPKDDKKPDSESPIQQN